MLLYPFPVHSLLYSVPPPPLPFPPQRVLTSERTVNHTLSSCRSHPTAYVCACVRACVCVCVCPNVHFHFQLDSGRVFLTLIFHLFLFPLFNSVWSVVFIIIIIFNLQCMNGTSFSVVENKIYSSCNYNIVN